MDEIGANKTATNNNSNKKAIEAILFAAGYAVPVAALASSLDISAAAADALCDELAADYAERGIQLIKLGDNRQLCTREEFEPQIRAALGMKTAGGLSQSALETLAVIAYNQPATRAFVEQVRGVDSSYAIAALTERGLIECTGKLDVPGRPNLYSTTADFMRCFGISSLDELPVPDLLRPSPENSADKS